MTDKGKTFKIVGNDISDGYHTFTELYEHRHALLSRLASCPGYGTIKSKRHFDCSVWEGWFIVQMYIGGKQISYHVPNRLRDKFDCTVRAEADERDGHTSDDVLERLLDRSE